MMAAPRGHAPPPPPLGEFYTLQLSPALQHQARTRRPDTGFQNPWQRTRHSRTYRCSPQPFAWIQGPPQPLRRSAGWCPRSVVRYWSAWFRHHTHVRHRRHPVCHFFQLQPPRLHSEQLHDAPGLPCSLSRRAVPPPSFGALLASPRRMAPQGGFQQCYACSRARRGLQASERGGCSWR